MKFIDKRENIQKIVSGFSITEKLTKDVEGSRGGSEEQH